MRCRPGDYGGMRSEPEHGRTLKQQLPPPYNQDLVKVLRGLKRRRTLIARRRQANDPVTAAYLFAAMRLIERHLGPGAKRVPDDPDDPDSIDRPLLGFLSQRAVAREVSRNPAPFPSMGRISTIRERWEHQSHFIADVLRFGLWASHYPAQHQHEVADAEDEMIRGSDPIDSVHRLCYWYTTRLLSTPAFRLELAAVAEAEGDPVIREAIYERHRENRPLWSTFYDQVLRSRGLRLRTGVTPEDCGIILSALADGLAMRSLGDPVAPVIDSERQRCLLGTAALMLIAGGVVSADDGNAVPLEDAARAVASNLLADREK